MDGRQHCRQAAEGRDPRELSCILQQRRTGTSAHSCAGNEEREREYYYVSDCACIYVNLLAVA